MRPKDSISYAAAIVAAGLLATVPSRLSAQASQTAPKSSENEECRGNGCAASPDAPVAESDAGPSAKPYDWKASFKEYKVGKVPRLADGHPDMQGIWSRTTLVPMERPRNQDKKEIDAATAAKLENEAQQKQFDLRTEPTDTPPGEKTTERRLLVQSADVEFAHVSGSRSVQWTAASAHSCRKGTTEPRRRVGQSPGHKL